jgi:hypothetical protein
MVKDPAAHSSPVVVLELALRIYPSVPTTSLSKAEEFLVSMSPLVVNVLVPPSGPVAPCSSCCPSSSSGPRGACPRCN